MARKSRAKYLQLFDLDYMDINRLTNEQINQYLRSATREANRRIRMLEAEGLASYSEAVVWVKKGGKRGQGKFTYKNNKSRNVKLAELYRAKNFLMAKTSTLAGAQERKKWFETNIGKTSELDRDKFWDLYEEVMDDNRGRSLSSGLLGSTRVQQILRYTVKKTGNYSLEDAIENMTKVYKAANKVINAGNKLTARDMGRIIRGVLK